MQTNRGWIRVRIRVSDPRWIASSAHLLPKARLMLIKNVDYTICLSGSINGMYRSTEQALV